jgi:hypothetical protein
MPDQGLADPFTRYAISLPFDYRLAAETATGCGASGPRSERPWRLGGAARVLAASADLQLRFEVPGPSCVWPRGWLGLP